MHLKVAIILIVFFFIWYALWSFYHFALYPFIQFFKKKNEFGYVINRLGELEHRSVVKKILNRPLIQGEEIHHINGKRWDNRRGNLALLSRVNHQRWHQRLSWMFDNKKFPSLSWQKNKLVEEFEAIIFK